MGEEEAWLVCARAGCRSVISQPICGSITTRMARFSLPERPHLLVIAHLFSSHFGVQENPGAEDTQLSFDKLIRAATSHNTPPSASRMTTLSVFYAFCALAQAITELAIAMIKKRIAPSRKLR